ncbi:MAG: FtsX-like permease family protein [Porticoccaceae bacterium]|nr:FtsX-like permease family protein [Porticoccaceae bacterium]
MIRNLPLFIGLRYFSSGGRNSKLVSFISLLALSGLSLGVGLLILVLSVMNGFDREMREHILSVVPHVQIINSNTMGDGQSQRKLISSIPSVVEVTPFNQVEGIVFSHNNTRPLQLLGLDRNILPKGLKTVLEEANLTMPADGELLLAQPIVDSLGLASGQSINIILPSDANRRAKIVSLVLTGIFSTRTEVDQMLGIVSLKQAVLMAGNRDEIYGFRVQLDDLFQSRAMAHRIINQLPYGFTSVDWTQSHGNLYQAIQLSRNMVALLVFLIVGIAAFNVISMLMMMVLNKRKDIAILQTMGASKKQVLNIFLTQGLLIALVGISIGVIMGIISCYWAADLVLAVEHFMGAQLLDTSIYPIDYVPVDLRWHDVIFVSLSALFLSLLATVYPAVKASNTIPAETLRFES